MNHPVRQQYAPPPLAAVAALAQVEHFFSFLVIFSKGF